MNNVTVVVKAGVFKDATTEIAIPEKTDVKSWIRESLEPVREQLKSLEDKAAESRKKQGELERLITQTKEELNRKNQETGAKIEALNKRVSSIENDKAQWESRFQALSGKLSSEFIAQCRSDIEKYFSRLAEETKALQEESKQISQKQQSVSEQLSLAVMIAEFFCERYKLQLLNNEKELIHITQLAEALNTWKERENKN